MRDRAIYRERKKYQEDWIHKTGNKLPTNKTYNRHLWIIETYVIIINKDASRNRANK